MVGYTPGDKYTNTITPGDTYTNSVTPSAITTASTEVGDKYTSTNLVSVFIVDDLGNYITDELGNFLVSSQYYGYEGGDKDSVTYTPGDMV